MYLGRERIVPLEPSNYRLYKISESPQQQTNEWCWSPTCRPGSVHPRRPRGSQSGWEKRGARTWNGFRRAFSPDPTDRPWVSEDGISIACVAGAKRGGKGGARKAPLSPLPPSLFPFFPIPCPFRRLLRRLGSIQLLKLVKNMKRQTDPCGKAMKK